MVEGAHLERRALVAWCGYGVGIERRIINVSDARRRLTVSEHLGDICKGLGLLRCCIEHERNKQNERADEMCM